MEGCTKCIKYLVFFFNFLFWIAGCAILGVGIWVRVEQGDFATLFPDIEILSAANIAIAAGCIIMVVGFLGCCGAIRESQILLILFCSLLILLFILELAAGILGLVKKDEIIEYIENSLIDGLDNYGDEGQEGLTDAWDRLQSNEDCCGVTDAGNWFKHLGTGILPDSCCTNHVDGCGDTAYNTGNYHTTNCEDTLIALFEEYAAVIGGVGIAIALMQILGIIFSIVLIHQIRNEGKTA